MIKKIDIAMISDQGFLMPTVVALQSLKVNRNLQNSYQIYLFVLNCQEQASNILTKMTDVNFNIQIIPLEDTGRFNSYYNDSLSATPTALYKFMLPDLLPECDKLLYIDGDVIIQKDLEDLFFTNIEGYYAAVVKDMPLMVARVPQMEKLRQKRNDYFNSGVLLLNLRLMRQNDIPYKLFEYKSKGINTFMDQDALNVVFDGNVRYLSLYYNLIFRLTANYFLTEICNFYDIASVGNVQRLYQKATIIHLASPFKPWKYQTAYLSALFEFYYNQTPYKNVKLKLEEEVKGSLDAISARNDFAVREKSPILFLANSEYELLLCCWLKITTTVNEECHLMLTNKLKKYLSNTYIIKLFSRCFISQNEDIDSYSIIYFNGISEQGYKIYYDQLSQKTYLEVRIFESNYLSHLTDYKALDDEYISRSHLSIKDNEKLYECIKIGYYKTDKMKLFCNQKQTRLPLVSEVGNLRSVEDNLFKDINDFKVIYIPVLKYRESISTIDVELFDNLTEIIGKQNVLVIAKTFQIESLFTNLGYIVKNNDFSLMNRCKYKQIIVTNCIMEAFSLELQNDENYRVICTSNVVRQPETDIYVNDANRIRGLEELKFIIKPRDFDELTNQIRYILTRNFIGHTE